MRPWLPDGLTGFVVLTQYELQRMLIQTDSPTASHRCVWQEETSTRKSAMTLAGNVFFVTRDLDLWPFDRKINVFQDSSWNISMCQLWWSKLHRFLRHRADKQTNVGVDNLVTMLYANAWQTCVDDWLQICRFRSWSASVGTALTCCSLRPPSVTCAWSPSTGTWPWPTRCATATPRRRSTRSWRSHLSGSYPSASPDLCSSCPCGTNTLTPLW